MAPTHVSALERGQADGSLPGAPQELGGGEFLARVQASEPSLRDSDRDVIRAILEDPARAIHSSVSELAGFAGTAQSSVVRTCQRLGYRGFQDVKMAVVRDLSHASAGTSAERLDQDASPAAIVQQVFTHSGHSLLESAATLDPGALSATAERVLGARYALVIGNGTSGAPAYDCAYRLTTLGRLASHPTDPHAQHLGASQLTPDDCCIVISHTGSTRESLQAAEAAKAAGAFVIAITSFLRSPLTDLADVSLVAGAPEQEFRQQATTSRLAHLAIIDALFVTIVIGRPTETNRALDATEAVRAQHTL